jgi:hypothetical protein
MVSCGLQFSKAGQLTIHTFNMIMG